ncbi:hypothetical protein GCM10010468_80150 [Actinocorallia longicatena]|uniref:Histidine kinase/HSP90-like ATPase domain-containing protein n=1 Tax=Actinocorallia longicatena TaxID=111803 RepID=A0ABP6QN17_9ACTN
MLLLSEAFTNATLYASDGPVHLAASLTEGSLRIEVVDPGGRCDPALTPLPPDDAEGGRGLALLDLIAKEWGWERLTDRRVRVWFTLLW